MPELRVHARALWIALMLSGCSASEVITDWVSDDAAGPEPVNYRFVIANDLDKVIGKKNPNERLLDISSPRRVDAVFGAAWIICVRTLSDPSRLPNVHYSVFIRRERIIESKLSAVIDQCERQSYAPNEWSLDKDNPVAR
ncbi:MAG: hypothetical protein NTV56_19910 [Alphaproteobacteria bacterium]|nr:hypothetical protein [Alphaproteobacteria bacterium]